MTKKTFDLFSAVTIVLMGVMVLAAYLSAVIVSVGFIVFFCVYAYSISQSIPHPDLTKSNVTTYCQSFINGRAWKESPSYTMMVMQSELMVAVESDFHPITTEDRAMIIETITDFVHKVHQWEKFSNPSRWMTPLSEVRVIG